MLTLDLTTRASSAPIVSPGATVTLNITARLTAPGGLQDLFYGIASSTPAGKLMGVAPVHPFNAYWQTGTGGPNGSIGVGMDDSAEGWVFVHAARMIAGDSFAVGEVTFTALSYGTTTLSIVPRLSTGDDVPAFWEEDGVLSWDAATPGTSVTITVAEPGDANLDGRISADDYALIDRGFAKGLTGWGNGDFNGDGVINAADYLLMDQASGLAASPAFLAAREAQFGAEYVERLVAGEPVGMVELPEPGVIGVGVMVGMRRRRKHYQLSSNP